MAFEIYNKWSGQEPRFVKTIKFHDCGHFDRINKVGVAKYKIYYKAWHIKLEEDLYKLPLDEDEFGTLPLCNRCEHQLDCINGKIRALTHRSLEGTYTTGHK